MAPPAAVPISIDEAKEILYAQPGESFVAERDALVKTIRASGDRALATEVKTLRKPSAVAAEVNQIVRADPNGVDLILQAAALLRSAQAGALDGTTINASELQEQYRAAIRALAQSATSRRAEVRAALEAATIDEASNEDLRTGCLVVVPTPVSIFGSAAPVPAAGARAESKQPVDELEERRARHRAEDAAKDKAGKDKVAGKKAAQDKEAKDKEEKDREAEKKAAELAAAKAAAEAKRKRKELQKRHRDAVRAHLAALDEEERAAEAVEQAEQDLSAADDEIAAAEQSLVELRSLRESTAAASDRSDQAKSEAHLRTQEAQVAVDALAEALTALEETLP